MNKPQCIVPWVYFFAEANGNVLPCCANNEYLGNVLEQDYREIWNSERMNRFRKSMLSKELPKSCSICMEDELLTSDVNNSYNLRHYYNNFFKNTFDEIESITNEDGSIKEDKIKFKSFLFKVSNKCNFQCRMCNGYNSSMIKGEVIENPDFYIKFVKDNIDDLELIEFVGGESFLMKETYDILDFLIKRNKPHPHLHFNTNMSVLNLGSRNIIQHLNKLNKEKIEVVASIDEIDERAEYIRSGCNWKIIERNIKSFSEENIKLNTNIVVSCYNVFRLPKIIERLVDIGHINEKYEYQNFMFHPVIGDSGNIVDCDISLLSKEFRKDINDKIYDFILQYNKKYNIDITYKFEIIFNKLCCEEPKNINDMRITFLRETYKKDKLRGEKLLKVIPELKNIIELVRNRN